MTLPPDIRNELERLLAAQAAGELSEPVFEQLAALLRQSPEARSLYVAHRMLEAQLEQEHLPPLTLPAEGGEGVSQLVCEAPSGPFRQKVADTVVQPAVVQPAVVQPVVQRSAAASWLRDLAHEYARQPLAVAILLLAMLFGGILIWNLSHLPPPQPIAQQTTEQSPISNPKSQISSPAIHNPQSTIRNPIVARLKATRGATWDEPTWQPGTELHAGQPVVLKAGLAEIMFDSGATVVLEGPAELEVGSQESGVGSQGSGVRSRESGVGGRESGVREQASGEPKSPIPNPKSQMVNSCSLTLGKLVARVPKQAHGFTVHTPTLTIVDLGTEFAVEVESRKSEVGMGNSESPTSELRPPTSTKVHVLRGEVKIYPASLALAQTLKSQILIAGQGLIADAKSGALRPIEANPTAFIRELPAKPPAAPLATWPKDSPLKPGDIVAVTCKGMKVFKVDPKTGAQTLLVQGIPFMAGPQDHGVAWHCMALAPDGTLLVGFDGLHGKEAGVVRIDPRSKKIQVLASGGLLTSGQVSGLTIAEDGTIYGVYDAQLYDHPSHIVTINPESGAVASVARLMRAQGMCPDIDGRSALIVVSQPGGVARFQTGTVTPWVSGIRADGCHAVAVAPDGRVYVTSIRDRVQGMRALLEVDRNSGREVRTVCELPQAPRSDLPWHIAVEGDGTLIAGPAVEDRQIYRVHPDTGKFQVLSSGGMLEDRTALAVVPGRTSAREK